MNKIEQLAKQIRYNILFSTTKAGSGHPTSSLSATDLMAVLFFGGHLFYDLENPQYPNNDRVIFSKGHASPLLYSLYAAAGKLTKTELSTMRQFGSCLEGHPTDAFEYTEAATGSLGQGLSIGVGMALNAKYLDKLPYKTYVLLGDSEMSEGSQWEAIQLAAHYKLNNLIGILDMSRLGQRGETMYGHDAKAYEQRLRAFNWDTITINGHSLKEIDKAYARAARSKNKPTMIIAKTIKGKGVSFLEDKEGYHGKTLSENELAKAVQELGKVNLKVVGKIKKPKKTKPETLSLRKIEKVNEEFEKALATRKAYGHALVKLLPLFPDLVVLDAETSNSTFSETFQKAYPQRFFEMFIAEQNMIGTAQGLAARGKIPFVSTFAAFLTRAFDQIRMTPYSGLGANIKFVGSHAGTSIGQDGPSQMGLEDIAMFRSVLGCVVLYPADHISYENLIEQAAAYQGMVYLRTTRADVPALYEPTEKFLIGGSKVLKQTPTDKVTIVSAGITLFEALKAAKDLRLQGINLRVIDCYSIAPIDRKTLEKAATQTSAIITVEDHYAQGGLGEAVRSALEGTLIPIYSLAVTKRPKSGNLEQLLAYEEIDAKAIIRKVLSVLK